MSDLKSPRGEKIFKILYEGTALSLVLMSVLGLMALASFHPEDPGWHNVSQGLAANWMGVTGAWWADVLLSLLGYAAWLLPLSLVYLAWQLIDQPWLNPHWNPLIPSVRLTGLLLLLMSIASLATLHFDMHSTLPYGAGGILGASLSSALELVLGYLGATLVLLPLCLLGASWLLGFSWLLVMDELGHAILQGWSQGVALKTPLLLWLQGFWQVGDEQRPVAQHDILQQPIPQRAYATPPLAGLAPEAVNIEPFYQAAVLLVRRERRASTLTLQRGLNIHYQQAEALLARMERDGVVSALYQGQRRVY